MRPNRTILRIALALLLFALAGAPALRAQPELDHRLSLELKDADVRETLEAFGTILEREIEIDPKIRGKVSIEVHNVRLQTVLDALCDTAGCVWRLDARRLGFSPDPSYVPPRPMPPPQASPAGLDDMIDIDLKDADVRETLQSFGMIAGLPVEIDDDVSGKVTVHLRDIAARDALDALCGVQGCVWEVVVDEEGASVLHVSKAE
jgi:type II secretory pathway component GspD/PulD (secretin)